MHGNRRHHARRASLSQPISTFDGGLGAISDAAKKLARLDFVQRARANSYGWRDKTLCRLAASGTYLWASVVHSGTAASGTWRRAYTRILLLEGAAMSVQRGRRAEGTSRDERTCTYVHM